MDRPDQMASHGLLGQKYFLHLDHTRTHWVGSLQTNEYRNVLAISDVHVYLTIPFILSWSLLEAMAVGCAIVVSDTSPVREVLKDGLSALLVDFFDVDSQLAAVSRLLDDKNLSKSLALKAQETAQRYSSRSAWRDGIVSSYSNAYAFCQLLYVIF